MVCSTTVGTLSTLTIFGICVVLPRLAEQKNPIPELLGPLQSYSMCWIWQDVRLLLSFVIGFLLTHYVSISVGTGPRSAGRRDSQAAESQQNHTSKRFKLYCYAM